MNKLQKNKTLSIITLVILLILCIMPAFAQPPSGVVSHWTFDEDTGTTLPDSVNGNDGELLDANPGNVDGDKKPLRYHGTGIGQADHRPLQG